MTKNGLLALLVTSLATRRCVQVRAQIVVVGKLFLQLTLDAASLEDMVTWEPPAEILAACEKHMVVAAGQERLCGCVVGMLNKDKPDAEETSSHAFVFEQMLFLTSHCTCTAVQKWLTLRLTQVAAIIDSRSDSRGDFLGRKVRWASGRTRGSASTSTSSSASSARMPSRPPSA